MKKLFEVVASFYPVAIFLVGLVCGIGAASAINEASAPVHHKEYTDQSPWVTVMESEPKRGEQKYLEVNRDTIKLDYVSGATMVYIRQVVTDTHMMDSNVNITYGYVRIFCIRDEYSLATLYNNKGLPEFDWGVNQKIKQDSGAQKIETFVCLHQV